MIDSLDYLYIRTKVAIHDFLTDEKGAVDLVTIVVLIAIAIVLAIAFRKQIVNLLGNIFRGIDTGDVNSTVSINGIPD